MSFSVFGNLMRVIPLAGSIFNVKNAPGDALAVKPQDGVALPIVPVEGATFKIEGGGTAGAVSVTLKAKKRKFGELMNFSIAGTDTGITLGSLPIADAPEGHHLIGFRLYHDERAACASTTGASSDGLWVLSFSFAGRVKYFPTAENGSRNAAKMLLSGAGDRAYFDSDFIETGELISGAVLTGKLVNYGGGTNSHVSIICVFQPVYEED